MLPITACSSTGQFDHDGSCGWQRRIVPSRAARRARPAPGRASPRRSRAPSRSAGAGNGTSRCAPSGSAVDDRADQAQRFERFVEAHRDARGDVAVGVASPCAPQRVVGRDGKSQRRSRAWPLARPARPISPSCAASSGVTRPQSRKRSCSAGVLVVDVAQRADLAREASRIRRACAARAPARGRARRRPARRSPSAADGRTPRRFVAQHVFLQPRELREPEREAAVVAEAPRSPR